MSSPSRPRIPLALLPGFEAGFGAPVESPTVAAPAERANAVSYGTAKVPYFCPDGMPTASARTSSRGADFRSIYSAWFADVRRWTRSLGGRACDGDDLAQDVFMVVHRRLVDFDGENLPGWLFRITARQVRDHRRRRSTRTFQNSVPLGGDLTSPKPTPAMVFDTRVRAEKLERIVAQMREPTRSTFVLFDLYGYSGDEIAARERVSINTVRARIQRARKVVQAAVADWQDDDEPTLKAL